MRRAQAPCLVPPSLRGKGEQARRQRMDRPSFSVPGSGWVPFLPPPVRPSALWLTVLIPKGDCTPFELEAVGLSLRDWQLTDSRSGHVWGLEDLLAGRRPRTPPMLPLSYVCTPDTHEPISLVCRADDAPAEETFAALEAALGDLRGRVVLLDCGAYCASQM